MTSAATKTDVVAPSFAFPEPPSANERALFELFQSLERVCNTNAETCLAAIRQIEANVRPNMSSFNQRLNDHVKAITAVQDNNQAVLDSLREFKATVAQQRPTAAAATKGAAASRTSESALAAFANK